MPSNSTAHRTSVASHGVRDRRPPRAGRRVTPDNAATAPAPPGSVKRWVLGARPRTLPAAIVPVVVGTAAAHPLSPRAVGVDHGWGGYAPLVHQAGSEVGVWWLRLGAPVVGMVGTFYVQALRIDQPVVWFAAVVVGLLATALLLANNLRDIETDRETGKHTLAVRVGRSAAGRCYVACVALPFVGVLVWAVLSATGAIGADHPAAAFLPLLALPLALPPARLATGDASGRTLLPVLAATGRLQLVFGALLSVSLWLWIS